MLSNLFTEFDKITVKLNVYKVYTIGDCYVVLGFLDASKRNPGLVKKKFNDTNLHNLKIGI